MSATEISIRNSAHLYLALEPTEFNIKGDGKVFVNGGTGNPI